MSVQSISITSTFGSSAKALADSDALDRVIARRRSADDYLQPSIKIPKQHDAQSVVALASVRAAAGPVLPVLPMKRMLCFDMLNGLRCKTRVTLERSCVYS